MVTSVAFYHFSNYVEYVVSIVFHCCLLHFTNFFYSVIISIVILKYLFRLLLIKS